MAKFESEHWSFQKGVKLSDMIKGTTFTFDSNEMKEENEGENLEFDFENHPGVENFLNPIDMPFDEQKKQMIEVSPGVWKRTLKPAPANAKSIDFSRHRITYHRNFFMENESAPFDSTYLNGKPDVVCQDTENFLDGFIEALGSMKENEVAQFIICYQKMFGVNGCMPRVLPEAEILAELNVLKVEEIGDAKSVKELDDNLITSKPFVEAKKLSEEGRLRAKDFFSNRQYDQAIKVYQKVLQILELAIIEEDADKNERIQLSIQILTNLATCYNMKQQPKRSLDMIAAIEKKCSTIDDQPKILFIKGKALRLDGEFKEAAKALKMAQKLCPANEDISNELEKLEVDMTKYDDLNKKFSENLFTKFQNK